MNGPDAIPDRHEAYVGGLQWKRGNLLADLASVRAEIARLTREEAQLLNRLRALETLLALEVGDDAAGEAPQPVNRSTAAEFSRAHPVQLTPEANTGETVVSGTRSNGTSAVSSKTKLIHQAVRHVLLEAGVPMHYRDLAEEVQKHVPINGADPGATLIAHLSRAQDQFPRVDRGHYWIADAPLPSAIAPKSATKKRAGQPLRVRRARRSR